MGEGRGAVIRVLHVDHPGDAAVVAANLERAHGGIEAVTRTSGRAGLDYLEDGGDVDCVVCCDDLPEMDGPAFLRSVRESFDDLPLVLFAGDAAGTDVALPDGVTEYVEATGTADPYAVLANRLERAADEGAPSRALRGSERMLATLISNLPGMVYRCRNEPGWPMEFVSEGCADLTGYAASALESGDVSWGEDIIIEPDRDRAWEQVQHAMSAGEPFEITYRIETKAGDQRWLWERGTCVYGDDEEVEVLEGFITDITARRERERELRDQQEFVQSLLDALGDPFYLLGPDGEMVRWNDRVAEVTGYTDAEIQRMDGTDFVAPEHRTRLRDALAAIQEDGGRTVELDLQTNDGDRIPFELRGAPVTNAEDEFVGVVGVARDVSDRVERELELEQYRTLVENVGDPMYVLDTEGHIRVANNALVDHVGYEKEHLVDLHVSELMPDADVDEGTRHIRDLLEHDPEAWRTWEMRTIHADGSRSHTENQISVLTDDDGEFVGSVGVLRDISERIERERELQRYETIIQAVGDPVYALDGDGVITFANEAFEPLTGFAADELVGRHVSTLLAEEDVEHGRDIIRRLLSGEADEEMARLETTITTRNDSRVPAELHVALLPGDDGEFRGTAGVIRDIQARKAREERLEEFASVVSHDLRNPLNVITGRTELAALECDSEHLSAITDAAERMDRLIEDLLALARQGETVGDAHPVDLDRIVQAAWRTVGVDEATLEADPLGELDADGDRLRELFENLFRNAVEHAGPSATVRVGPLDDGFYVADDGPGIPPEVRDDVLEHGYTTSDEGTGFGLSIVEGIVTAHGWSLTIEESAAGGARFEIRP